MSYNTELQTAGLCGHICPDGPFQHFCCTRPADHILDGEPVHQAIQLSGPIIGRINGAWSHDGTPAMEPVDMAPIETCGLEQPIDQPGVEGDALLVHGAARHDARPRDREAVRRQAELAHQRDVLGPAAVVVGGDVAGGAVVDRAGRPSTEIAL